MQFPQHFPLLQRAKLLFRKNKKSIGVVAHTYINSLSLSHFTINSIVFTCECMCIQRVVVWYSVGAA